MQEDVKSRVADILARTPFTIKEFHTRETLAAHHLQNKGSTKQVVTIPTITQMLGTDDGAQPLMDCGEDKENLYELAKTLQISLESEQDLILLGGGGTMDGLTASNSQDILSSTSPIFGYHSCDVSGDLALSSPDNKEEPDDNYGFDQSLVEDFRHGITNINYDFDVSDHSADHSTAAESEELLSKRLLIEESPKDILLPSPLIPNVHPTHESQPDQ